MNILQAIVLGIIQGLTEFLPISSSAHLIIFSYFLDWEIPSLTFNVLVQIGTLGAVIFYFRRDLYHIAKSFVKQLLRRAPFATHEARLGWLLILATIPAGVIGFVFKSDIEGVFASPLFAGIALIVTAILMLLAEKFSFQIGDINDIKFPDALVMGLMQALAIFPGISRSGATISGGMFLHLKRKDAGRFSFLMSIPIMLAAGVLETYEMITTTTMPDFVSFIIPMAAGFFTALIVGYVAIRWLLNFIVTHSLRWFSLYCLILGSITIVLTWIIG
jgi:undecaprenyl-diphosphatase